MNHNICIIARRYCQGEAWTSRLLAYAKGLVAYGCNVKIIFIITDEKRTPYYINIDGVEIINLWEQDNWLVRIHRGVSYYWNKRRIGQYLNDGDICLMFDGGGLYLDEILSSGKDVKIYYEITEHPYILDHSDNKEANLQKQLEIIKKLDGLLVISNTLKGFYESVGVSPSKIKIVNMFVDTDRFRNLKKQTNEKYIGYCGVVSYEKDGVDILIQAFSKVHAKHPEYKLYIFGRPFDKDTLPKLKDLSDKCGVMDSVVFTGMVSPNDLPQKLVDAEILALARPNNLQNANGFPTKLGEYLATGNIVVATKVGDIPKFLTDGVDCLLANAGDVDSIANKLLWAIENENTAHRIASQGRKKVFSDFSCYEQCRLLTEFF